MIWFRPGSHVRKLCVILAVTGEIPVKSLFLLGSQRVYRALVAKLIEPQKIINSETGETLFCRLLTLHGKGAKKSVRFYKAGLPVLDWIGVREFYMSAFWNHKLPSDDTHVERNFRLAEAAIVFMQTGCEFRPWEMEAFQGKIIRRLSFPRPSFYAARELKDVSGNDLKKIQYARFIGTVFTNDTGMTVYNTRDAVMKWNGMSEFKARQAIDALARMNTRLREVSAAILLGDSEDVAVRMLESFEKERRVEFRFDSIYEHVYFVPMNADGIRQLRLLLFPDWNAQLLSLMFAPDERSYNLGSFVYDAIVGDAYVLVFLDGDLPRLIRFRSGITPGQYRHEVLCFPHQVSLVKQVLGDQVDIRITELEDVENALGLKGGTVFES